MFRRIRIRAGSANFCPYNTPSNFLRNTPFMSPFQCVAPKGLFIVASYADRHKTTSLNGLTSRPADCEHPLAHGCGHGYRSSSSSRRDDPKTPGRFACHSRLRASVWQRHSRFFVNRRNKSRFLLSKPRKVADTFLALLCPRQQPGGIGKA